MKGFSELMKMTIDEAKKQFGSDFDTSPSGTWYKLMAPLILSLTYLESKAIANKRARNIYTAQGDELDDLLTNDLIFRIEGSGSKGTCKITGNGIIDIPINSIEVKGTNGLIYTNVEYGRITNGNVILKFECTSIGSMGNIPENNIISTIKAPNGINDVQNNTKFTDGLDRETDYEYLQRYLLTIRDKEWSLPAIKAAVRQLDGVKSCDGIRNNTLQDGVIKAKSIRIVVDGGNEDEIAKTIYLKVHTANTVGNVSKQIEMSPGQFATIKFDRPKETTIDFQYSIISPNKDKIIELIKEYLNEVGVGEIISAEEFRKKKLDSVTIINTKVLDLGFKKQSTMTYSPYIQLSYDEKAKAGTGVTQ